MRESDSEFFFVNLNKIKYIHKVNIKTCIDKKLCYIQSDNIRSCQLDSVQDSSLEMLDSCI